MTSISDYEELINLFLGGAISAVEFEEAYLRKFKNDGEIRPDSVFVILDKLFSEVDAFVPDTAQIDGMPHGKINSEEDLKAAAKVALCSLTRNRGHAV